VGDSGVIIGLTGLNQWAGPANAAGRSTAIKVTIAQIPTRLGCARLGSPGIFWDGTVLLTCSAAYFQLATISKCGGLSGEFSPGGSGVTGCFLNELHARAHAKLGVDVGEM